ncbi:MAG: hypothetical protein PF693_07535 [Spirochaetia bacterium]|jgi:hypothetical protein|nr:hypothetical protein [Spirochaetia bacterium]
MKRKLIIFIFIITVMGCYADNNTSLIEIEGLYHITGQANSGIEIQKLGNENYIFRKVFIDGNGKIHRFEWQGAYVRKGETNKYVFYWHTGRFDDDMPVSNGIIVYELEATGNGFEGIYFFPEETRTPPARVSYEKIE